MEQDDIRKTDGASWQSENEAAESRENSGMQVPGGGPDTNDAQNTGGVPGPTVLNEKQGGSVWLDAAALIGVFFVANLIGGLIGVIINKGAHADREFAMFVSYATAFVLTIIFAIWQRMRRGYTKPMLRFSLKKANPALILWGLALVIITSVVIEPLLNLFPMEYLEGLNDAIGTGGWAILTTIIAAPILEEVLFRGLVQQSLTEKLGGWRGVLAAAAIFGIIHIIPQQVINAFFIGLILGYIYIKTQSLLPVILIHAINNAIAFIQMKIFGDEALMTTRQIINNDVVYWIVYGAACAIFVVAAINLWKRLRDIPGSSATKA